MPSDGNSCLYDSWGLLKKNNVKSLAADWYNHIHFWHLYICCLETGRAKISLNFYYVLRIIVKLVDYFEEKKRCVLAWIRWQSHTHIVIQSQKFWGYITNCQNLLVSNKKIVKLTNMKIQYEKTEKERKYWWKGKL